MNEVSYVLWLPEELHTALKMYAAQNRASMREVILASIEKYIAEDFHESRDPAAKADTAGTQ